MQNFSEKVVVITGGSSGIGLACVKKLVEQQARVIILDCQMVADNSLLGKIDFRECDMRELFFLKKIFSALKEEYGNIDFAINNAGIMGAIKESLTDYSIEEYEEVMQVNARSVWFCLQQELMLMKPQQKAAIVNVSSVAGMRGSILSAIYSMSKFALHGLTYSAALEYAQKGIRINTICPGAVDTPLTAGVAAITKTASDMITHSIPIGRMGTAEEIANLIVWLLSEEASFITGSVIPIDGGMTARI